MMKLRKPESFLNSWTKRVRIGGEDAEFLRGYNLNKAPCLCLRDVRRGSQIKKQKAYARRDAGGEIVGRSDKKIQDRRDAENESAE